MAFRPSVRCFPLNKAGCAWLPDCAEGRAHLQILELSHRNRLSLYGGEVGACVTEADSIRLRVKHGTLLATSRLEIDPSVFIGHQGWSQDSPGVGNGRRCCTCEAAPGAAGEAKLRTKQRAIVPPSGRAQSSLTVSKVPSNVASRANVAPGGNATYSCINSGPPSGALAADAPSSPVFEGRWLNARLLPEHEATLPAAPCRDSP